MEPERTAFPRAEDLPEGQHLATLEVDITLTWEQLTELFFHTWQATHNYHPHLSMGDLGKQVGDLVDAALRDAQLDGTPQILYMHLLHAKVPAKARASKKLPLHLTVEVIWRTHPDAC